MQSGNSVKESLDVLVKKWPVDQKLYDMQVGLRTDAVDTQVRVEGVVFHVPMLSQDSLYVLWKCLWPDCHNCCERQGRLPLTKDDIALLARKMGYQSRAEFVRDEARVSSWEQDGGNGVITTLSMLSLKRKKDERDEEDGTPLRCRFLDDRGYCGIHPDKPGVCWLYPFASWLESENGRPVVHATFQFTGDCPGFYLSESLDPVMPVLQEYAKKIYDYNMAVQRTTRENYGFISFVNK